MKKTTVTMFLMHLGVFVIVFGQMNGVMAGERQHRASESIVVAQQKDVTSDQKTGQEARQSMTALMKRMSETMQKMTDTFENKADNEGRNLSVLGKMMRELSLQMSEMAACIQKGKIEPQTVTNLQARLDSVNQRIDALQ